MSQHTPGPWQVNHWDKTQVCDADGEVRGCAPIAYCEGSMAERKANARLIAAAPELLAALQKLLSHGTFDDYPNTAEWHAVREARTAITSATGEGV
jgi:hypothetical protein